MSQTYGEILAILVAFCGAASSVLYNQLGKQVSSDVLASIRMFVAAPIMVCYALIVDGFILPSIDGSTLFWIASSGFIGFFITDLFLFRAYVFWGARETMVVMCLSPVFSGVLALLLFDEVLTIRQIIGSLMSLAGVVIMALGDKKKGTEVVKKGFFFAFMAALFQSVSDLTAKFSLTELPWVTIAAIRAVVGATAWYILRLFTKEKFAEARPVFLKPKFFLILVGTLLIGTVIGTTLAMGAIKFAPVGIVTSLKQVSPIMILAYEFIFLRKHLNACDFIGTFVSVFGVFLLF